MDETSGRAAAGSRAWAASIAVASALVAQTALAQGSLTPQDVAEIERLSAMYAERLAACDAAGYADLFAANGAFVSTFRRRLEGRAKLIELVESERHCRPVDRQPLKSPPATPRLTVEASPTGARATGLLPNVGQYEDTYVKTGGGWRFQVREFLTSEEVLARQRKGRQ
jgi:hypothetical protein